MKFYLFLPEVNGYQKTPHSTTLLDSDICSGNRLKHAYSARKVAVVPLLVVPVF